MYLIYSFLVTLGVLFTAPYYLWKRRTELAGSRWRERFGLLPEALQQEGRGAIWVHAVSVGETLAIVRLVSDLKSACPERKVFLSTVTPAGARPARAASRRWPAASTCLWTGVERWERC